MTKIGDKNVTLVFVPHLVDRLRNNNTLSEKALITYYVIRENSMNEPIPKRIMQYYLICLTTSLSSLPDTPYRKCSALALSLPTNA